MVIHINKHVKFILSIQYINIHTINIFMHLTLLINYVFYIQHQEVIYVFYVPIYSLIFSDLQYLETKFKSFPSHSEVRDISILFS